MFEGINRFVDAAGLLEEERRVEPGRGIMGVAFLGERQFPFRVLRVAGFAPGLPQVAAEQGALRFEGGSRLQIVAALDQLALANAAEPTAKPGVAERAIEGNGVIKLSGRFT